ncbi:hypothetical protein Scep_017834 [Stephania cephalantha]|uniref:Uncharacterized protein n=1 Tax=Stephania cephalantha TaxID=152367 RepID=A0AAP0NXA9_9MAGN
MSVHESQQGGGAQLAPTAESALPIYKAQQRKTQTQTKTKTPVSGAAEEGERDDHSGSVLHLRKGLEKNDSS